MRANTPEIAKLPAASVLAVTTVGDPNTSAEKEVGALYGTAYGTKFKVFKPKKRVMEIGCLSAFWPDAHLKPKSKWTGIWNLEVSAFVKQSDLIQKDPKVRIKVAKRLKGTVAQILHIGMYSAEGPTVKKLHAFIKEQGYRMSGPHEEVYLTRPGVKNMKTLIRYRVTKAKK
jgi:hypothetical protein